MYEKEIEELRKALNAAIEREGVGVTVETGGALITEAGMDEATDARIFTADDAEDIIESMLDMEKRAWWTAEEIGCANDDTIAVGYANINGEEFYTRKF